MNNGRVAVLCPTRNRPAGLKRLAESVRNTSSARIIAYVDEDQDKDYLGAEGVLMDIGARIGPVAAANLMAERYTGFEAYGLVTDDSTLETPGWDEWLIEALKQFPNRIAVVSPHHNNGNHVDMPFVSREWIDSVGWFACPALFHYAWPTITQLIGEMTAIVHAPEQSFHIQHDYMEGTYPDRRQRDYEAFYNYVSLRLPAVVERVRQAMSI